MRSVVYVGLSNFRHLAVEDLKRLGVEVEEDLHFVKGELTEVEDEVARVLTDHDLLTGEFVTPEQDPAQEPDQSATAQGSPAVSRTSDDEVVDINSPDSGQPANTATSSSANAPDAPARSDTVGRSEVASRSEVPTS